MRTHICRECGSAFTPKRADAAYCNVACKRAFNNRRAMRGAELYDLWMIIRHERLLAKAKAVWSLACAMATEWKRLDEVERDGRPSWRPAAECLADKVRYKVKLGRI